MIHAGWLILAPFVSPLNFLGRLIDDDGTNLGSEQYEIIVKERYLISKRLNTSYSDTGDISVHERRLLLKYIADEINQEQEQMEQHRQKIKNRSK